MNRPDFTMHLICRPKELWATWPGAPLTDEQKLEIMASHWDRPIEFYKDKDMSAFF
jgi:hypothetical protein